MYTSIKSVLFQRSVFILIAVLCASVFSCTGVSKSSGLEVVQRETEAENTDHMTTEDEMFISGRKFIYPVTNKETKTIASVSNQYLVSMNPSTFKEVWGYLISGEESSYKKDSPVTDIGYFGAGLNTFGELTDVPDCAKLSDVNAKIHMVIADNGRALTHFCLSPEFSVRKKLIASILEAAKPFDGLQIDFELVSAEDKEYFWSFLKELKAGFDKNKIFSIAIPARTRTLQNDAYNYEQISKIVDKVIVMAYDEHWSGSKPGPVASMDWCEKVLNYASSVIPQNKLVMGLPFYGRAWSNDDTAGAYRFSSIDRLFRGENAKGKLSDDTVVTPITIDNGIPTFTVSKNVTYTFYFDNAWSLSKRLQMYTNGSVQAVAFWRIGQEDTDIWKLIKTEQ